MDGAGGLTDHLREAAAIEAASLASAAQGSVGSMRQAYLPRATSAPIGGMIFGVANNNSLSSSPPSPQFTGPFDLKAKLHGS